MLWIVVVKCLIGAILGIIVGGSYYEKDQQFSSLMLCCLGCGLLAFTCMVATMAVFLT